MPKALAAAGVRADERLRLRRAGARGAGLHVLGPVAEGEVLLMVPSAAHLTGEGARRLLGADGLDGEAALCALLATARRDAEKGGDALGLREYLLALPGGFPSLPLCFSEGEAAAELRGTALLPAVQALRQQVDQEQAAAVQELGPELEAVWSDSRWRWARAVLLTRAGPSLGVAHAAEAGDDGAGEACTLVVPLVDFCNCAADPSAECRLGDRGEVALVARRALEPGAEVTITYGAQSREQLLFTFGFALAEAREKDISSLCLRVLGALTSSSAAGFGGVASLWPKPSE
ncbi:unnamed protein product, partial [Prorocentrum cordatum]